MAYLNGLGLKNFRVFKESEYLEFRPITVLTGPNGSGKSSVIKSLLLLQEGEEKENSFKRLKFSSKEHQLGKYEYVVNKKDGTPLEFYTKFNLMPKLISKDELWVIKLSYSQDKNNPDYGTWSELHIYDEHSETTLIRLFNTGINLDLPLSFMLPSDIIFDATAAKPIINLKLYIDFEKKACDKSNNIGWYDPRNPTIHGDLTYFNKGVSIFKKNANNSLIEPARKFNLLNNDNSVLNYLIKTKDHEFDFINPLLTYTINEGWSKNKADEVIKLVEDEALSRLSDNKENMWDDEDFSLIISQNDPFFRFSYNNVEKKDGGYYIKTELVISENYIPIADQWQLGLSEHKIEILESFYFEVIYVLYKRNLLDDIHPNFDFYNQEQPYDRDEYVNDTWVGIEDFFSQILSSAIKYLSVSFKEDNLSHLSSIRSYSNRVYFNNSQDTEFGLNLKRFYELFPSFNRHQIGFLNFWIKEFNIADGITIETPEGAGAFISLLKPGMGKINIVDTGFGFSQVIAILIRILLISNSALNKTNKEALNYKSSVLIIEEPESNLHPNLQSKVADMLMDAADSFHIQFIIETHSEYIIRKLQYLTAKKAIKPSDSVIYYFNPKESQKDKVVDRIDIKEDGRLSQPFGPGFYDESTRLMLSIFEDENLN